MDALLPALVLAALLELGDTTQALTAALRARFGRPAAVLAGVAAAAALNAALGAAAGAAAAQVVNHRAMRLVTAVALLLAGAGALFPAKAPPRVDTWRLGTALSAFGSFFILAFGDKTQFVVAGIAGGSGQPALAAAGAALGIMLGNVPALVPGWPGAVPVRTVRIAVGVAVLAAGLAIGIVALGLA